MKHIHSRPVLLIDKGTVPRRKLGTECLSIIDKNNIAQHDNRDDQSKRHIKPIQAHTIDPRVLGKDEDGGDRIADEYQGHEGVGNDLGERLSANHVHGTIDKHAHC